jgi:hypothetical protein
MEKKYFIFDMNEHETTIKNTEEEVTQWLNEVEIPEIGDIYIVYGVEKKIRLEIANRTK